MMVSVANTISNHLRTKMPAARGVLSALQASRFSTRVEPLTLISPVDRIRKNGCALIMSNGFADDHAICRTRESKKDLIMMEELWKKKLGCSLFKDQIHKNLTARDMRSLLHDFSKTESCYDYLVVYVSSHGGVLRREWWMEILRSCGIRIGVPNVGFLGEDGREISESELMSYFCNDKCSHAGVTKFFILDYCRDGFNRENVKAKGYKRDDIVKPETPLQSDNIAIYAAHRDHPAIENEKGSLLTQKLHEVFKENWESNSLTSMLTMVNKEMKASTEGVVNTRSMSIFVSSLVDDFTFYKNEGTAIE